MGVSLKIGGDLMHVRPKTGLRISHALAFLLLLLRPIDSSAQETRTIDGKRFTIHTVEAGQTLFAIGRSYAVPVDALVAANPEAKAGLRIGQELLVPMYAVVRREARSAPTLLTDGELMHTVARKETLFGIARTYGLHINDLLERNPDLNTSGLREGMEVVIPVAVRTDPKDVALRPAEHEESFDHQVAHGETLYSLGQRYGVAPERIQAANAGLPEGLKAGQIIRVPRIPGVEPPPAPRPVAAAPGRPYRIGLLLPFALDRNDSLRANAMVEQGKPLHEATRIAAQFYAGARLALEEAEAGGLMAEVTVLDMGEDPRTWNPVLKRAEIFDMELCIGPFHRSAIEQLARAALQAHVVCPVPQSNKVILGNPNVSKVSVSRPDLIRQTGRYVAQRHARDQIILLRPDIHADREAQEQMARTLTEALADQPSRLRDSVMVARPGRRDLGDLPGKLSKDRLNVIVAPSFDLEFVTNLVGKLKPLAARHRIVLVGMDSWLAMESVAAADLDMLGFLFASPTWVDHEDPRVQAFTHAFRERFGQDVDEYAFLGFDVTRFYLKALAQLGTSFSTRLNEVHTDPLHMGFRMSRTGPENGYRNEYAVMLQQKELRLVKAP